MKRCSTSLIIREMQTKATVRYHLTQVRMAIIKKSTNHKWWRGCGKNRPLLHCWWERKLVQPLRRTIQRFLTKHTLDPEARLGALLQYLMAFLLPFSSSVSFWMSLQPPGESKKRPWLSISRIFECGFTAKIYYALIWLVAFCFESGGWWRWQSLLLGILHYYRNKWIFFLGGYNQSNRSQGDSRRAREVAIHWDVPDLNSIQSWGGKLDVMQSANRSGRTPARVTRVPRHTLVWAKGSRHSLAATLQRQTRFILSLRHPPSHRYPLLKHHLISCRVDFPWGSSVLPPRSFAWLNSSYTDHFFLFIFFLLILLYKFLLLYFIFSSGFHRWSIAFLSDGNLCPRSHCV